MSKVLVIKGASFAANKVETIDIMEPIPCTGLSVSPTTVSFTAIGATQQLTATKTPADTTDTVSYASSNESVATVSRSGLVTCVGIGSATITVMCGEQSATCAVVATVSIVLDDAYYAENGAKYSGSLELPTKNHIGRTTDTKARLYYSTDEFGTYRAFTSATNAGKYLIPLPKGATKVTIIPPEGLNNYVSLVLGDANTKQTYVGGADGQSAMGIWGATSSVAYYTDKDISAYVGDANGFIASVQGGTGTDASTITGKTTIIFA